MQIDPEEHVIMSERLETTKNIIVSLRNLLTMLIDYEPVPQRDLNDHIGSADRVLHNIEFCLIMIDQDQVGTMSDTVINLFNETRIESQNTLQKINEFIDSLPNED